MGTQIRAGSAGVIDLLCIAEDGTLVIVEFKRDRTSRDTIAQALDYASWIGTATADDFLALAATHLNKDLAAAFDERFNGSKLPAIDVKKHRVILAAPDLDAGAERIVRYLADEYKVPINAVFFKYAKTSGGTEILARTVLVPVTATTPPSHPAPSPESVTELQALAAQRGVSAILTECRKFSEIAQPRGEEFGPWYGGSVRYWKNGRVIVGINISGKRWDTPNGQVDAWVQVKRLAEAAGQEEATVREVLSKKFRGEPAGQSDFLIRLRSPEQAQNFVEGIKALINGGSAQAGAGAAAAGPTF